MNCTPPLDTNNPRKGCSFHMKHFGDSLIKIIDMWRNEHFIDRME